MEMQQVFPNPDSNNNGEVPSGCNVNHVALFGAEKWIRRITRKAFGEALTYCFF